MKYGKTEGEIPIVFFLPAARLPLCVTVIMAFLAIGCGSSASTELPNSGKSTMVSRAITGFEVECIPVVTPDSTSLDMFWGLPPEAMTFVKTADGFRSVREIDLRVIDRTHGGAVRELTWSDTTLVATYAQTQSSDPNERNVRFAIRPGAWLLEVSMEDVQLRTRAARSIPVEIPDPRGGFPSMGRITVEWREPSGGIVPFVFFHVPSGLDSLRVSIPLYNFTPGIPVSVRAEFQQFTADSLPPIVPYLFSSIRPVRQWRSLGAGEADTILAQTVSIVPNSVASIVHVPIPFSLPALYRVVATAIVSRAPREGGDTTLSVNRVISLKGRTFPRPSTIADLIGPLTYIAHPDEMDSIRMAKTAEARRDQFDLFWLRRTGDRVSAADLLKSYYSRVEEANRFFSTFNEGWKTERGMLYIVLGPPTEIQNGIGTQSWIYEFSGSTQSNIFTFTVSRIGGEGIALYDYTLQRQAGYETQWDRLVDAWRTGRMY